ncbi:hypothetical protein IV203_033722 [Nitzschia inconspicua]|uniref:Uncharacterized protein n=1 Tax=Nitzschia inconspicua TaxID=303405 RepID=A0A9K3M2D5_9STRA|nr:hypothetical protein IV203_033722 [Nitzschia inconspicua]
MVSLSLQEFMLRNQMAMFASCMQRNLQAPNFPAAMPFPLLVNYRRGEQEERAREPGNRRLVFIAETLLIQKFVTLQKLPGKMAKRYKSKEMTGIQKQTKCFCCD